ncbi:beta-carotene isomerase D27, chloroplastic [Selaginella moellendorffii]|uniref:beta-carotene isomerase D27, chloroplastic n=1 Tax=Selaginella moellendorffii TaxID=88036 RepID=UPI000D1C42BD|nr:beta-carotene isomerase D27, chloroplastic [Selaginella moellendorffii]|eukprot:XP_024533902.1 beta-carotene isomerase D27, chloroplastic [Selaginella moellendorffii]
MRPCAIAPPPCPAAALPRCAAAPWATAAGRLRHPTGKARCWTPRSCPCFATNWHRWVWRAAAFALVTLARQEVGRDADRPGYDGLIQLSQLLMAKYKAKSDVEQATVRILNSMFPQSLLRLFRAVVLPINKGKLAAILSARVTQATCQWLMGTCSIGSVELSDGTSIPSGVLVEKCKYLEHSKCAGICIHTCKLPTQAFISKELGVPLLMEPNFADLSCQFKFGVEAPSPEDDPSVSTPCLEMCPTAIARKSSTPLCPKV